MPLGPASWLGGARSDFGGKSSQQCRFYVGVQYSAQPSGILSASLSASEAISRARHTSQPIGARWAAMDYGRQRPMFSANPSNYQNHIPLNYNNTTPPPRAISPASASSTALFASALLLLCPEAPLVLSFVVVDATLPAAVEVAPPLPVELFETVAGATTTELGILRSANPSPQRKTMPLPARLPLTDSIPTKESRLVKRAWRHSVQSKG